MVSAIIYQLTRCMTPEEIKRSGFEHLLCRTTPRRLPAGPPRATPSRPPSSRSPATPLPTFTRTSRPSQKARKTYDNILRLADDPDVRDPIKFLREREVVHFQRFGDALRITQENLDAKNFYAFNPSFE